MILNLSNVCFVLNCSLNFSLFKNFSIDSTVEKDNDGSQQDSNGSKSLTDECGNEMEAENGESDQLKETVNLDLPITPKVQNQRYSGNLIPLGVYFFLPI